MSSQNRAFLETRRYNASKQAPENALWFACESTELRGSIDQPVDLLADYRGSRFDLCVGSRVAGPSIPTLVVSCP